MGIGFYIHGTGAPGVDPNFSCASIPRGMKAAIELLAALDLRMLNAAVGSQDRDHEMLGCADSVPSVHRQLPRSGPAVRRSRLHLTSRYRSHQTGSSMPVT